MDDREGGLGGEGKKCQMAMLGVKWIVSGAGTGVSGELEADVIEVGEGMGETGNEVGGGEMARDRDFA